MNFKAVLCIVLALTIMEFRTLLQIHRDQEMKMVMESEQVADRRAGWKAFQSRVAGPYAIRAYSRLTGASPWASYELFVLTTMLVSNLLAYHIGSRMSGQVGGAWAMSIASILIILLLQDYNWLYPWDFIDEITIVWLAYLIWARASLAWFVLVFLAELFNREAAGYIGLWLMLDGSVDFFQRRPGRNVLRAVCGLAMVCGSAVITHLLRASWLPSMAEQTDEFPQVLGGQEWHLPDNLYHLTHPTRPTAAIPVFILIGFIIAMIRSVVLRRRCSLRVALWVSGVLLINVFLAILTETRIWISVVPLILPVIFEPLPPYEDVRLRSAPLGS